MAEAPAKTSSADRILALLRHLGLERVHLAGCMSGDWGELVAAHADRLCSLTVVAPHLNKGVPERLGGSAVPGLVIAGEAGTPGERARGLAARFGNGELVELRGYESPAWADTIAERTDDVAAAIGAFLERAERARSAPSALAAAGEGEVAGISYRIDGQGPALVLLPLSMSPSQWDPLVDRLARRYAVVRLGGPHLGIVSLIEDRAASGYGDLVADVLARTGVAAGEAVLEVGCGSGALARALARRTRGETPIVAGDLNPYLLREARALAARDGLAEAISFEAANAEALPYADGRFDVAYCCTVLEEGDADRMIAELVRVVRPGGRIAVVTRALDVEWWANLELPRPLKRALDALGPSTGSGVGERGCADASLYARLSAAGLALARIGPQLAVYRDDERLADVLDRLVAALPPANAPACREAIRRAEAEGTLFVAEPFHCAVGRR